MEEAIERLTSGNITPFLTIAKEGVSVTLETRKYTATKVCKC